MKRWQAFNAVCGHLRAGLLGGHSFDWHAPASWKLLVELSSHHNVTPALAWCLKDEARVPADVLGYFDAVLTLNGKRNERLLDGLARVVSVLNAIDIEPVLLKGAAHLVEGIYPASGLRVVGDLDILVPEDRAKHAAAALKHIGFVSSAGPLSENHLHLPLMYDHEMGVDVELHTRVELNEAHAIVPAVWFRQSTRPFPFRGLQIRLPDATRSIVLNIVHSQLNHGFYGLSWVELRQLLDLAMIRARQESAIDWAELDRRFSAAGFADALATYLKFAEVFFGQPAPRHSGLPGRRSVVLFRVAVERRLERRQRGLERIRARLVVREAGAVDEIVRSAEITVIRGWAADFAAKGPARSVQVFINGRPIAAPVPNIQRPDVAAGYGIPAIGQCGFKIFVKASLGPQDILQVFAELRGGIFAELAYLLSVPKTPSIGFANAGESEHD